MCVWICHLVRLYSLQLNRLKLKLTAMKNDPVNFIFHRAEVLYDSDLHIQPINAAKLMNMQMLLVCNLQT